MKVKMTGLTEKASIKEIILVWLWAGKKKNRCKKTNEWQIITSRRSKGVYLYCRK
jgi:hypothetical protein